MSTAVATREKNAAPAPRKTVDQVVAEILPPQKRDEMFRGLPAHIKPEVFERNLHNCLMNNPALMLYHPSLIYREVSKAAALGLLLDLALGEAYMIEAYNYKTRSKEPQLRVGYRGMMKLVKQTGGVEKIYCREVCANDEFIPEMGTDEKIIHRPVLFGDRGPIIGYYAVIKFKDGGFDFEPMSIDQIHRIRDRSDGWKAFKDGKISSTPWSTDEDEMAKKTTIRRLVKRQTLSAEMATAIDIEDRAEFPGMGPALSHTQPTMLTKAPNPPPDNPEHSPLLPPSESERHAEDEATGNSTAGEPSSAHEQEEQIYDWTAAFEEFDAALKGASTYELLEEIRDEFLARDGMPRSTYQAALTAYDRRVNVLEIEEEKAQAKLAEQESAQRGAEKPAAETEQSSADQSSPPVTKAPPPPSNDDDDFPGDKPSKLSVVPKPPVDAGPTPAERDIALSAQRDPAAMVRVMARKKAAAGTKKFNLWYKTISEADAALVDDMPDLNELIDLAHKVDAGVEG